jgi:hypothetical protein
MQDVVRALEVQGLSTMGKECRIEGLLARRVKKHILNKTKVQNGWIYWAE